MAVIIGGITPRTTLTDSATLELLSPWGAHALTSGGNTFVYVAAFSDDGIAGFQLGTDGLLTSVVNLPDSPLLELDGATGLASAVIGGSTYLYAGGFADDGLSAFRVNADGTLASIQNIPDNATLNLDGPAGAGMAVATVGASTFLAVPGRIANGFSVFQINADGTLTNTDNEADGVATEIGGAFDMASATVNGRVFLFVAGLDDDGVSVYELDAAGNAAFRSSVDDASDAALELDGAFGVATATVAGVTYLVASGQNDDGLSVFSVSDTGALTNVFNVADNALRGLNNPGEVTTFALDGETFVAVSSQGDNALGIFHLGAGGVLTDVTTVLDSAGLALGGSAGNAFAAIGNAALLVGTGFVENGITSFDLGGGADVLVGTAVADLLLGLGGDDSLDGGDGDDRMLGGTGDDTYTVGSAGDVVEERAGAGTDTVRAAVSFTLGENLENLALLGTAALDGTGNGLDNALTGNDGANRLRGRGGRDEVAGGNGADDLEGNAGVDRLSGGRRGDALEGGRGRDLLAGEGGGDDFIFVRTRDSGPSRGTRDQILDFGGRDDLVLTRVDAVAGVRGNQAFALDQDGDFAAGEIRLRDTNRGLLVEMNTDADARAEMSILLRGFQGTLNDNDFEF